MAFGRYSRVDGRKSSSYCSTISVVVFVAFCLVGIWVFMSSTVPVQDQELPSEDATSEVKRHIVTDDNSDSKQFEDTSGDAQITEEVQQEETALRERSEAENEIEPRNESDEKTMSEGENANSTNEDSNTEATETNESERPEPEEREESGDEAKQISNVDRQNQQSSSEQSEGQGEAASELLQESKVEDGGAWSTQTVESQNEKKSQQKSQNGQPWKLCNVTAGPDYIPCLDNWAAIRKLRSTKHYEHRERHCPEEPPTCLVPLPEGYKRSVKWPTSRDKIWYNNVPHIKLAEVKGHQNWVKASGEYLIFPGGGTQFKHGALRYIDFVQKVVTFAV